MNEQRQTHPSATSPGLAGQLRRRGLLGGTAAVVAAALARVSARPAEATDNMALIVSQANSSTGQTQLNRTNSATSDNALRITNNNGGAVRGEGAGGGGVIGTDSGAGFGLRGESATGQGVHGHSVDNIGVFGHTVAASNASPGVLGQATQGYGVFGFSQNSNGIAGQSGGSAAGCVGFAGAPGGYGIYGGTAVAGGYAGGFARPVLVVGDFTATGGAKSAAVPHPDGTHRRLYCMESPESLFEDFGAAKLVNGHAQVTFDPDFVAVVHNDKYLVFPVPEGDCKGLYVSDKSPTGFEVRELQGGVSTLPFSYRVVAKRKDIPAPRLEKVKLPQPIKELVKPDLPKPAEPPKAPEP